MYLSHEGSTTVPLAGVLPALKVPRTHHLGVDIHPQVDRIISYPQVDRIIVTQKCIVISCPQVDRMNSNPQNRIISYTQVDRIVSYPEVNRIIVTHQCSV